MSNEKVVCRKCSYFVAAGDYIFSSSCKHRSCFEATGYDPVTGNETLRRVTDYHSRNNNLNCPDFKKKWFLL